MWTSANVRESDSLDDLSERLGDDGGPADLLSSERLDVSRAMQRLTSEQRQVLHLRFVEDMTSQQAAVVLGKSEAAVKIIQHRALKSVKQMLGQDFSKP